MSLKANVIFFQSRWELLRAEHGLDSLSVLLRPWEDPEAAVRVVCSRPEALHGSRPLESTGIAMIIHYYYYYYYCYCY